MRSRNQVPSRLSGIFIPSQLILLPDTGKIGYKQDDFTNKLVNEL